MQVEMRGIIRLKHEAVRHYSVSVLLLLPPSLLFSLYIHSSSSSSSFLYLPSSFSSSLSRPPPALSRPETVPAFPPGRSGKVACRVSGLEWFFLYYLIIFFFSSGWKKERREAIGDQSKMNRSLQTVQLHTAFYIFTSLNRRKKGLQFKASLFATPSYPVFVFSKALLRPLWVPVVGAAARGHDDSTHGSFMNKALGSSAWKSEWRCNPMFRNTPPSTRPCAAPTPNLTARCAPRP